MRIALTLLFMFVASSCYADAFAEFNEWRRRCGLPQIKEDPEMTKFAEMKAIYRAQRNLKDGHQGPKPKAGWREGTAECHPSFGFLACCQEEDAVYGGAGMCIGRNGERWMVLVVRGGSGKPLIPRNNVPVHDTSKMTPNPPDVRKPETLKRKPEHSSTGTKYYRLNDPRFKNIK